MTKQAPGATDSSDRPALTEIEITPAMVEAGCDALREHHYDGDVRYMVECIYRAMGYARDRASSISSAR